MINKNFYISGKFFFVLMLLSSIYGGYNYFSPVPVWDTWDGHLEFLLNFFGSDIYSIFRLHNEHPIILTRILFIINYKIFGGGSFFLVSINYILVFLFCLVFYFAFKRLHGQSYINYLYISLGLSFAWMQNENFIWSFQSQFFLCYLLPFASYFFYSLNLQSDKLINKKIYAAIFLFLAVLSTFTMANGIFTLVPIIFIEVINKNYKKSLYFLLVFLLCAFIFYLMRNISPNLHNNSKVDLLLNFHKVIFYNLVLIGSPFYNLFGGKLISAIGHFSSAYEVINYLKFLPLIVGFIFGLAFYFLLVLIVLNILGGDEKSNFSKYPFFLFVVYFLISALLISIGRFDNLLSPPYSSRYTTPAIYGWISMLALTLSNTIMNFRFQRFFFIIYFILLTLFLLIQLIVFRDRSDVHRRFEMGFECVMNDIYYDEKCISLIANNPVKAYDIAHRLRYSGIFDLSSFLK